MSTQQKEEQFSTRELDSRFDAFQDQLDRRFSGMHEQINSRVSHLQELVNERFENLSKDGWTLTALRDHFLGLIDSNGRRYIELIESNKQQLIDAAAAREVRFSELIDANDKRYLVLLEAQREVSSAALASSERAVQKAEVAAEKRFDSVNEFRSTLSDQQRNLMPRAEVDVTIKAMTDRMAGLEKQIDAMQAEGRGIKGGYGYAVGVIGFVAILIGLVMTISTLFKPGGP